MDNRNSYESSSTTSVNYGETSAVKSYMANVFSFMFAALLVSGVMAYATIHTSTLFNMVFSIDAEGYSGYTALGSILRFAPFAFILTMSLAFNKLSSIALTALLFVFAATMGMSLSSIFIVYTSGSIASTFLITAATFGIMAVLGYTTKTDLSKFGSILKMALFGLIIAIVVNWFMQSGVMDYVISMFGVLIFTGLTAYDTQYLKRQGEIVGYGNETASKLAIMGALNLYLNFINLFLFLLTFLGNRD